MVAPWRQYLAEPSLPRSGSRPALHRAARRLRRRGRPAHRRRRLRRSPTGSRLVFQRLVRAGPASPTLAEKLGMTAQGASKLVIDSRATRLRAPRQTDPADRRSHAVSLTERGWAAIEAGVGARPPSRPASRSARRPGRRRAGRVAATARRADRRPATLLARRLRAPGAPTRACEPHPTFGARTRSSAGRAPCRQPLGSVDLPRRPCNRTNVRAAGACVG